MKLYPVSVTNDAHASTGAWSQEPDETLPLRNDIDDWMRENCKQPVIEGSGTITFTSPYDKAAFMLRWTDVLFGEAVV